MKVNYKIKNLLFLFLSVTVLFPLKAYAQSAFVNADIANIRKSASTSSDIVFTLENNSKVDILSTITALDGSTWYQISFGNNQTGYIRSDLVKETTIYPVSDISFENHLNEQGFPESYKNELRGLHSAHPNWVFFAQHTGINWDTAISEESKIGRNLVYSTAKSSWKSIEPGAFDWKNNYWPGFDGASWQAASKEIIAHYMDPRNFLNDPYIFQFELQSYDPSIHTKEGLQKIIKGTFLEKNIFIPAENSILEEGEIIYENESVSPDISMNGPGMENYGWEVSKEDPNEWYYKKDDGTYLKNVWEWLDGNQDGIAECYYFYEDGKMAYNTYIGEYKINPTGQWTDHEGKVYEKRVEKEKMGRTGSVPMKSVSYADIIMEAAEQSGVSPYILASMILQEQGEGTSDLISGNSVNYPGYYNFFNIGAYEHDGMNAVTAGLYYAAQDGTDDLRPWNTIEKAIIGGAISYGKDYVKNGQDTFYLKKFNVQGTNAFKHQYMTNVSAAASEAAKMAYAYDGNIEGIQMIFKIPVYANIPETFAPMPTIDGSPNNKLRYLEVQGYSLTPSFNLDIQEYSLIVENDVENVVITADRIDNGAIVEGTGQKNLKNGLNNFTIKVTAENGSEKEYKINIMKRGIEGSSMPGISMDITDMGTTIGQGPGI